MAKIIGIVNQKGGVGKTTTTISLGAGLVKKGKKVLLVDADPQGSLSAALGIKEPDELPVTLSTLMRKVILDDDITKKDINECLLHQHEGLIYLPANIELAAMEQTLTSCMEREYVLQKILAVIENDYDYILIDCMPSLGIVTINVLTTVHSLLIPMQAQYLSLKGMQQLFKTVARVKKGLNRNLQIEGILITMQDNRTNYNRDILSLINEAYGNQITIFKSVIPQSIRAAETSAEGKSIYAHDPSGKVAAAYQELTEEVIRG